LANSDLLLSANLLPPLAKEGLLGAVVRFEREHVEEGSYLQGFGWKEYLGCY
jgi:hypothetical protein